MGWGDWLNVIGSVVDVTSNVVGLIGDSDDDGSGTYSLGTVQFTNSNGAIGAWNSDQTTSVVLNYALTTSGLDGASTSTCKQQLLPPNGFYDATSDLSSFSSGGVLSINAAPNSSDQIGGAIGSALSFATRSLSLATSIAIVNGISGSFSRTGSNPVTYSFNISSTGPQLSTANISIRGTNDTKFESTMSFSQPSDNPDDGISGTIDIPSGVDIDPLIKELDITIYSDDDSFDKLLKSTLANCRPAVQHTADPA